MLKRYDIDYGQIYGMVYEECKNGSWCESEDVEELEQQNAKLIEALTDIHECSRLPQKHRNRIIDEIISVSKKALDEK